MLRTLTIATALICLCLTACSGRKTMAQRRPSERLEYADALRDRGDYLKAVAEYEQVLSEFPAPEIAEAARYGLAQARIGLKDYELARRDLEDFIDSYPRSDLVDNAMYLIALSHMKEAPRAERDQTATVAALDELNLLLREYPETEILDEVQGRIAECRSKLAEKEYLSGRLYLRMKSYRAAQIYFDLVVEEYGDTSWAPRALLGKARALARQKDFSTARQVLEDIIQDYPGSPESEAAAASLRELASAPGEEAGSAE